MRITFLGNFQPGEKSPWSSETHHAKSLEALGHEVIRLQEGHSESKAVYDIARDCDLFVWVHTHGWVTPKSEGFGDMSSVLRMLKEVNIPTLTYHLDLWLGIDRQKDLEQDHFYKEIEWFFATDKLMCDWFNKETNVKGRYLPAGVFHEDCYLVDLPDDYDKAKMHDVLFVGSRGYHPEWQYRPKLIDWLRETYGERFGHYGGDGLGVIRGNSLNSTYAASKVVVGDSLCINFDYPYYWSDRVYETLGRGGFLIMPYIKGLDEHFKDGKHLVYYEFNDFKQLKMLIDYYIENPNEREKIRYSGHHEVKNHHTYKHRWEYILKEVFGENA